MPDHATKRCRTCGEVKPAGQFHRDRAKRDGRRNICRECEHERSQRRYAENRDASLERSRQYYEANGAALRDYQRHYRESHREKISERDRRYYQDNREKIAAAKREYEDANRSKINEYNRQRRASYRDAVLDHYGRICACPGCYSTRKLGIDHLNGDGRQHRIELFGSHRNSGAAHFHLWLIRNDFPPGYQTLCSPCNTSKGTGDRCRLDHDLEYDAENDAW